MSSLRVQSWLLALVSLLAPATVRAQAPATPPEAVLAGVESGKVVRARLHSDRTVVGQYAPVGDGRLGIRTDAGTTDTLSLTALRELSVRGRHTKTGAIVGGIAGVAFGVFVGVMVNALCEGGDDCQGSAPYLIAIPAFGGGGALLGAAVGSAFPKWKRVFP